MLEFGDDIYVQSTAHLEVLCDQARYNRSIGIDLEFIRERTYFARLALVQIAVGERSWLIDPLDQNMDLSSLESLVTSPEVCKVMHAPSQDLEIFYHRCGAPPRNVFDTQRAAAILGLGQQVGYNNLVQKALGIQLKHSEGFTNWLRRPLTQKQEAYALDDVKYLFELRTELEGRLKQMERLSWCQEECQRLEALEVYERPPDKLYKQVKSRNKLDSRGLAILRELAHWREEEAKRRDKLRRSVILDEVLVSIALRAPEDRRGLGQIREFRIKDQRSQEEIIEAIARGQKVPLEDCPKVIRKSRLDKKTDLVVDLLKTALKIQCDARQIAPAMVATSSEIERLVRSSAEGAIDPGQHRILSGWRGELVGGTLVKLLRGELGLRVDASMTPVFVEHQ